MFAREKNEKRGKAVKWKQEAILAVDDGTAGDRFGWSIRIYGGYFLFWVFSAHRVLVNIPPTSVSPFIKFKAQLARFNF